MAGRLQALLATFAVAGIVTAAAGAGGEKFTLLGDFAGARCDGSGVTAGTEGGYGSATISGTDTVKAKVSVKGLTPNTEYFVRLIQGVDDCGVADASFTTNPQGKAHVNVSEASVSTHAYVFIFNGPATEFYVTETYFHAL